MKSYFFIGLIFARNIKKIWRWNALRLYSLLARELLGMEIQPMTEPEWDSFCRLSPFSSPSRPWDSFQANKEVSLGKTLWFYARVIDRRVIMNRVVSELDLYRVYLLECNSKSVSDYRLWELETMSFVCFIIVASGETLGWVLFHPPCLTLQHTLDDMSVLCDATLSYLTSGRLSFVLQCWTVFISLVLCMAYLSGGWW